MTNPSLFKPFKHKSSNQVYSNQEHDSNPVNPIIIADSEFKTIWGSSPSALLDIVVSLGSGLSIGHSVVPTGSEKHTKFSEATRHFKIGKTKRNFQFDQQCEKIWNDYLQTLPSGSTPVDNYIRLNIKATDLPAVDDISSVEDLRNMVRTQVKEETIQVLASRLIAKLFYFERLGEMEMMPGSDSSLRGLYLKCPSVFAALTILIIQGKSSVVFRMGPQRSPRSDNYLGRVNFRVLNSLSGNTYVSRSA